MSPEERLEVIERTCLCVGIGFDSKVINEIDTTLTDIENAPLPSGSYDFLTQDFENIQRLSELGVPVLTAYKQIEDKPSDGKEFVDNLLRGLNKLFNTEYTR